MSLDQRRRTAIDHNSQQRRQASPIVGQRASSGATRHATSGGAMVRDNSREAASDQGAGQQRLSCAAASIFASASKLRPWRHASSHRRPPHTTSARPSRTAAPDVAQPARATCDEARAHACGGERGPPHMAAAGGRSSKIDFSI
ncbi:hypothetical protein F511_35840 [Dorcoceras hygrometricum]|uniref:Uncharacterized protein n=1 Tax=Dorcoceras hygrometricum TaxID=472368 RepID=A0A2Z7CMM5_9LAMI|nr:hypothetical protein F511_35840 [Dorcoceras hygrometricum]